MKKILIVGATSSIASNCARLWVQSEAVHFILVGRDKNKLKKVSDDLITRNSKCKTELHVLDFIDSSSIIELSKNIQKKHVLDILLIAHGLLPNQNECQSDPSLAFDALMINGISPCILVEAFINKMIDNNHGSICVIGSVAGDRGRKSNYIYGSAKKMIEVYLDGLSHRIANTKIKVTIVKPGPTSTPMTEALKKEGASLASVSHVSRDIVKAIKNGKRVVYTPIKWSLIMIIVRNIPNLLIKKINI